MSIHTYNEPTCTCCRKRGDDWKSLFRWFTVLHVDRYCSFNNSRRPSFLRDGASLIFNDNISSFTWDYVRCASNATRTFDLSRLLMINLIVDRSRAWKRSRLSEQPWNHEIDLKDARRKKKGIFRLVAILKRIYTFPSRSCFSKK